MEWESSTTKKIATSVLAATIAGLAIGGFYYRYKYDLSPIVRRTVEEGDTLTCYAKYEGITNPREIRRYVEAMKRLNDFYIPGDKKAIDEERGDINIKISRQMDVLDYDRDGFVGCSR